MPTSLSKIVIIAVSATLVALGLVLWRIWPLLMGRAKEGEPLVDRMDKWNRYVGPLFKKTLGGQLQVAQGKVFRSKQDMKYHGMATWCFEPTILPKVDYVALAQVDESGASVVHGMIAAQDLRDLLPGYMQTQVFWGHTLWICVIPEDFDLSIIEKALIPIERFRERHYIEDESGSEG